jgi:hypothetical protein
MKNIDIIYQGQSLTLTRFWGNKKLYLWIKNPSQRDIPKMEFVGGHPDEWCIFIENLTDDEKRQITDVNGEFLDVDSISESEEIL